MSNRTTLTDNNTWNTTHIATVGRAMASPERKVTTGRGAPGHMLTTACWCLLKGVSRKWGRCPTSHVAALLQGWEILRSLGADYFFVYYGGLVDYPADDISKLTWIMRIAGKEYPEIKEDLIYALDYSGAHMRCSQAEFRPHVIVVLATQDGWFIGHYHSSESRQRTSRLRAGFIGGADPDHAIAAFQGSSVHLRSLSPAVLAPKDLSICTPLWYTSSATME